MKNLFTLLNAPPVNDSFLCYAESAAKVDDNDDEFGDEFGDFTSAPSGGAKPASSATSGAHDLLMSTSSASAGSGSGAPSATTSAPAAADDPFGGLDLFGGSGASKSAQPPAAAATAESVPSPKNAASFDTGFGDDDGDDFGDFQSADHVSDANKGDAESAKVCRPRHLNLNTIVSFVPCWTIIALASAISNAAVVTPQHHALRLRVWRRRSFGAVVCIALL